MSEELAELQRQAVHRFGSEYAVLRRVLELFPEPWGFSWADVRSHHLRELLRPERQQELSTAVRSGDRREFYP